MEIRTEMSDGASKAVARRFVDEVLGGEDERPADDLVASGPLRQRVRAIRDAFPDLSVTVQQLLAEGDLVAVHLTARGTHAGVFQGCPPTGRRWAASCTGLFRVADGRIADFWVNWDDLAILEQIGAVRRVSGVSA